MMAVMLMSNFHRSNSAEKIIQMGHDVDITRAPGAGHPSTYPMDGNRGQKFTNEET
jgi:hypothetical protein